MNARSWESPNPPVLTSPDPFLPARLRLEDAWLGPDGEWRALRGERTAGLWSILGYLRWHAPALKARDRDGAGFPDPDAYLRSRPLVVAIDAELASRHEIEPGEAIVTMRAAGPAPWELAADPRLRDRLGRLGLAAT